MADQENNLQNHSLVDFHEIDVKEIISVLWKGKLTIILVTLILSSFTALITMSLTNVYTSESLLTIKGDQQSSSLSKYSGLASLAGINLPSSGGVDKGELVRATIMSRAFLDHLIAFDLILPSLMAVEEYNEETRVLSFDRSLFNEETNSWIKGIEPPTAMETWKTYTETVYAKYDKKTGFFFVAASHISPRFSRELLDLIINEINSLLRQKDIDETTAAIKYLSAEYSKTSLLDTRNSITELIQGQLQTQTMAKISNDYVLQKIEPPFEPILASFPNKILILILGSIISFLLSIMLVLLPHYMKIPRE